MCFHVILAGMLLGEQWCDAVLVVINLEEFGQTGLTDVETHQHHFLA